ncbi:TerC family protein [Cyclobacterium qasimii]|uniref:Integral membrane protein TerC n=2 Tax=Cyclobacterium qasimii TaxID=1350429 RepID=S7WS88_9BACT|nr:TerC family protein [Cyclobacterium qasimii]EPR66973.1 Integral membrane protein TerC [Cyclobacterium qasimii M12-11B]GEO20224.1 membrane protein [Cyclobacterium qasimii]
MEIFLQTETWIALLTLTFLEIILGVDNIIFISIVSNKLPHNQQDKARKIGLALALVFRILLLLGISYIVQFTQPIISIFGFDLSGRDLILFFGGLFLLFKSTMEIHHKIEGTPEEVKANSTSSLKGVILQIVFLDIIFSFDSILTAVGLVEEVAIMIIAVVISIMIMMSFAGQISRFINEHPTLQVLALSFLMLIGFMLLVEGLHFEVPKGYIYFAVFFSLLVEIINMRVRKKTNGNPVELKPRIKQKNG